jgi:hypothetical protein
MAAASVRLFNGIVSELKTGQAALTENMAREGERAKLF